MDLTFNEREIAFRDELRGWLAANAPEAHPTTTDEDAQYARARDWQRKLADAGWAGVHWPVEYGGRGATLTESAIFFEELGRARAPLPANVLGLLLAGPTIMVWGTDAQKERLLNPILTAEEIWCQGFSEPEAGSDLARSRRARSRTATSGSSPARRCGRRARSTRSGACSSRAPTPRSPSTRA
jgi:alkylation response protein AidB-like acyl-CoA dehydrogenase